MRIGQGYDVHAFGDGDHVMLGGVRVPHDRGVIAHSDGDVVLHALCDALLGALALGDIGQHFPPSDPRWRGADSRRFLCHCKELIAARLNARKNHFMPPGLLDSQFKTLEEPTADEYPLVVDIDAPVDDIADRIVALLDRERSVS